MEVKIIDETHQEFNGQIYGRDKNGYYRSRIGQLHVNVWKYHNGEIPKGWDVHHLDHNPANNQLDNLQCMPHGEHKKLHAARAIKVEATCIICGTTFLTRSDYPAKTCSPSCRSKYRYKQKIERICVICNSVFTISKTSPRKTCCLKCERILQKRTRAEKMNLVECQCAQCCKTFYTDATNPSHFCSKNCRNKYRREHNRVKCTCQICGKEFETLDRGHFTTRTCSPACAAELRRLNLGQDSSKEIRTCLICGKQFAKGPNSPKTCSPSCARKLAWQTRHSNKPS